MELGLPIEPHRPKGRKRDGRTGEMASRKTDRPRSCDFSFDRFGIILDGGKRMGSRDFELAVDPVLANESSDLREPRLVRFPIKPRRILDLVCECGDRDCAERITLTMDEYRELRSDPLLFAVLPAHEIQDVEDVVQQMNGWLIVRKHEGEPAAVARATDQ